MLNRIIDTCPVWLNPDACSRPPSQAVYYFPIYSQFGSVIWWLNSFWKGCEQQTTQTIPPTSQTSLTFGQFLTNYNYNLQLLVNCSSTININNQQVKLSWENLFLLQDITATLRKYCKYFSLSRTDPLSVSLFCGFANRLFICLFI